jgi:hypothetical protein
MTTMATLFKRFALWKAQEGATVGELEQYQASVSLPGTVKMAVLLRAFSWTSVGLIVLWSWFYLGSLAVSSEYTSSESKVHTNQTLIIPSVKAPSIFQNATGATNMQIRVTNSAFLSAMQETSYIQRNRQTADENSKLSSAGADSSNAALIPLMEISPSNALKPAGPRPNDWREVIDWYAVAYTAKSGIPVLLGIPVDVPDSPGYSAFTFYDFTRQFIGTYTMSTSYIFPDCSDVILSDSSLLPAKATRAFPTFFDPTNHTVRGLPTVDVWTLDKPTNKTVRGRCTLARHFVDVQGKCDRSRCVSTHVRRSLRKDNISSDTPFQNSAFSQQFFNSLLLSAGTPRDYEEMSPALVSQLEYSASYFNATAGNSTEGPPHWRPTIYYQDDEPSLQAALSQRMAILINTYLAASQPEGSLFSPADVMTMLSTDAQAALIKSGSSQGVPWAVTTEAKGAPYQKTFILVIPWIVLDFITCTILLLAAIISVWLRLRTVCPDVFGYISSMTRDNPHIPVPVGGSTMSGTERARAMKHVRVKIGELEKQDGAPGHIGLALEHPEIPMDRLRRKGEYL